MSTWEKLPPVPVKDSHRGCLNCPPVTVVADLDMLVAVGFGIAQVRRDGDVVYSEPVNWDDESYEAKPLRYFEEMAQQDPDHDWRVLLFAPLSEREYQRQETESWVLVRSGLGFA